jgi:hypothetical protein
MPSDTKKRTISVVWYRIKSPCSAIFLTNPPSLIGLCGLKIRIKITALRIDVFAVADENIARHIINRNANVKAK